MKGPKLLCVVAMLVLAVLSNTAGGCFEDNFDDGDISDWAITTTGTGTFDISSEKYVSSPFSIQMTSLASGDKAIGVSPSYDLDLSENYEISFSFLIPDTTNHWFEAFNNHHIYLVIDSGDDFKCYDGSVSYLIDELATDQWHFIEVKAHPSLNSYDVYVNSQFKRSCQMWIHTGLETNFRIGERNSDQTYYDYGQAYWDDIVITQPVDSDGDGIVDPNDNCPYDYNPGQADRNSDGWGDVCECIAANIDGFSFIDFIDFSIFASDWQQNNTGLAGDINGSELVDFNDLEILAYHWLSDCFED